MDTRTILVVARELTCRETLSSSLRFGRDLVIRQCDSGAQLLELMRRTYHEPNGCPDLVVLGRDIGSPGPCWTASLVRLSFPGVRVAKFGACGCDRIGVPCAHVQIEHLDELEHAVERMVDGIA